MASAKQMSSSSSQEIQLRQYKDRLKTDIKSLVDHFFEILKLVKVDTPDNIPGLANRDGQQTVSAAQMQQSTYEMHVRAANMTRAAESILKLISDLKQFIIINDFPLINSILNQKSDHSRLQDLDLKLMSLRDDISNELYDLEDEFYNSIIK